MSSTALVGVAPANAGVASALVNTTQQVPFEGVAGAAAPNVAGPGATDGELEPAPSA